MGVAGPSVSARVRAGRLHRLHRGVYAVGHTVLSPTADRLASVLSLGNFAVASHVTAAAIWEIRFSSSSVHHVTVPGTARDRGRIRVHRRTLHLDDTAIRNGVVVTSLARTLIDLGDVAPAIQVRNAFVRAEQLRLIDMRAIDAALARTTTDRRLGPRVLRELLRVYDPRWQETRSTLELAFLDFAQHYDLPEPEVNVWIDNRFIADFLWRDEKLIVETDGRAVHGTATARRDDARRDHSLARLGYRVLHVDPDDLNHRPGAVAARIRQSSEAA